MENNEVASNRIKQRPRWFRFGLSTLLVVVAIVAVGVAILQIPRQQVWEYKAVEMAKDNSGRLTQFGTEGWELVAVVEATHPNRNHVAVFYFKRAKR